MNFLSQAYKYKHDWWRYVIVLICHFLLASLFYSIFIGIVYVIFDIQPNADDSLLISRFGENGFFVFMMMSFGFLLAFFLLFFKWIHKGKTKDIFTSSSNFRFGRFIIAACTYALWQIIWIIVTVVSGSFPELEFTFDPSRFFIGIIFALLFLPIQTGYEEVVFRAYLPQALALITKNKVVIILLCSILFGMMHFYNEPVSGEGGNYWMLLSYMLSGIVLSVCAILDNGLEVAIGMHMANNLMACVILSYPNNDLSFPSLFSTNEIIVFTPADALIDAAFQVSFGTKHNNCRHVLTTSQAMSKVRHCLFVFLQSE